MSVSNEFSRALTDEVVHLRSTVDRVAQERDTLIACLREVLSASDSIIGSFTPEELEEFKGYKNGPYKFEVGIDRVLTYAQAHIHAKSTLSKYER